MPSINVNVGSVGDYIREQRHLAQVSVRQLAAAAGVSNPYLSQVERGLRKPSAEILQQIAKGLRISAETLYVRAGILDHRVGTDEVRVALESDTGLTDRQKRVLLDIYESFHRENAREGDPDDDAPSTVDGDGSVAPDVERDAANSGPAPDGEVPTPVDVFGTDPKASGTAAAAPTPTHAGHRE